MWKAHWSVNHLLLDVENDDGYGDGHGDEDDDAQRHQNGRPVAFDVVARHGILSVNIILNSVNFDWIWYEQKSSELKFN